MQFIIASFSSHGNFKLNCSRSTLHNFFLVDYSNDLESANIEWEVYNLQTQHIKSDLFLFGYNFSLVRRPGEIQKRNKRRKKRRQREKEQMWWNAEERLVGVHRKEVHVYILSTFTNDEAGIIGEWKQFWLASRGIIVMFVMSRLVCVLCESTHGLHM